MRRLLLFLSTFLFFSCGTDFFSSPADYVDPFIGTDGHGHTFPGATVPFAMVQLSPDTGTEGWDRCSGYHSSDSIIMGFSHTHLSGTGCADLGDILFMPTLNKNFDNYHSAFSHKNEEAEPGYYSVYLDDARTSVELTSTLHTGVHKYRFKDREEHYLVIDLDHGIGDHSIEGGIKKISSNEIEGYRRSGGWADDHTLFFCASFSEPFESLEFKTDDSLSQGEEAKGVKVVSMLKFPSSVSEIEIKVGISYVDTEGAWLNLHEETDGKTFDEIKDEAYLSWDNALGKIEVEGNRDKKTIFYTALYHSMIAPYIMSDVDGRYISSDRSVHEGDEPNYGLFSTWDTFRALHPLMTIVNPKMNTLFVKSLIRYYNESGRLPVWDLNMRETFCMIGYHSVPIITDAYMKGADIDAENAYKAMIHSSTEDSYLGLGLYRRYHYIPCDLEESSVSRTLEFSYDDWCIAMMAKALGYDKDYRNYIERAQYYKNLLDPKDTFMKGRDSKGRFHKNFSPSLTIVSNWTDYTEGNSWHYSFFAPQDVNTLINLMGGDEKFAGKLEELFNSNSAYSQSLPDITGLIGNYSQGNEPSHHSAYLFSYAGEQWRSAYYVNKICSELFNTGCDGLCGNDDCGQMSAWYVLSAMGFYQVTPGLPVYTIGTPQFEKVVIKNDEGEDFVINTTGHSAENIYIGSASWNENPYTKSFITHDMIHSGGELLLNMQPEPNRNFGLEKEDRPCCTISDYVKSSSEILDDVTFCPFVNTDNLFFTDTTTIHLVSLKGDDIFYTTSQNIQPAKNGRLYKKPIFLDDDFTLNIVAKSKKTGLYSDVSTYKFHNGRIPVAKITYSSSPGYSGKGARTLIDGLSGGVSFTSGGWAGWNGGDVNITIELPEMRHISSVGVDFLTNVGRWIALPSDFEVELLSSSGKVVSSSKVVVRDKETDEVGISFQQVKVNADARSVVIKLPKNVLPSNSLYHGSPAWVFIDEIVIR